METGEARYRKHIMWCKHDDKKVFGMAWLPVGAEQSFFTHETFPTVVMAHGLGSDHTHMDDYARLLAENGFVAYAIDFCGGSATTKSDGTTLDMTVQTEKEDLLAAVNLMLDEPFVNKDALFLWGNSQGGYVSAMLAEEMPETFRALVLLYPGFVLRDAVRQRIPDGAEMPDKMEAFGIELSPAYARAILARDPYADMGDFKKDVLIVHGDRDQVVPLAYSQKAIKAYPSARIEVLDGAEHGFKGDERDRCAHIALEFLKDELQHEVKQA